jgi:hypothetical protein
VPLLAADEKRVLEARTILGELDRRHPGGFSARHLRTLQRRIRQWRALNGPDKEVFFPQEHPPGREAAYDCTNCDELDVTICGTPFDHLLFELALSFSGWRWPTVALSESYEAPLLGVQEALWRLGGVVEVLRYDYVAGHIIVVMCPSRLCCRLQKGGPRAQRQADENGHIIFRAN